MSDTNKSEMCIYVSTAGNRDNKYVQERMEHVFAHMVALRRDRYPDTTFLMMSPFPAVENIETDPIAPAFKETLDLMPTVIIKMLAADWIFFDYNYKLDRLCRIEHFIAHEYNLEHLHMPEI